MPIRSVNGILHVRFQLFGEVHRYTTKLRDTPANRKIVARMEAKEYEARALEIKTGVLQITPRRFDEAAKDFLISLKCRHKNSPRTLSGYGYSLQRLIRFFNDTPLILVQDKEVQEYINSRSGKSASTVLREVWMLSRFFTYAKRMRWCAHNPVSLIDDLPSLKGSGRVAIVSEAEEAKYFAVVVHPFMYDFARLMLLQGFRPSELLALRCCDVNLADKHVFIQSGKTDAARRYLTLTAESVELLSRRVALGSPWVFSCVHDPNTPLHYNTMIRWHRQTLAKAGVKFDLYTLRHTYATRMRAHTDAYTLKDFLGHTTIKMTEKYVHPDDDSKRQAVERFDAAVKQRSNK